MDAKSKFEGEGGYVFVSHSHHDIKEVREVRNYLEGEGLEPILFYLKSMDDGDASKTDTLKKLIYDEIDARQFFLYLDSANARNSKWVRDEVEYVKNNHPERLIPVDLKQDKEAIIKEIERLVKSMRIFISCAGADSGLAFSLKEHLIKLDFRVFWSLDDIKLGENYSRQILRAITEASEQGFVLVLVTKNSMSSVHMIDEINAAIYRCARIIPIIVGDVELSDVLSYYLSDLQHLKLPENYTDKDIDELVTEIKKIARASIK